MKTSTRGTRVDLEAMNSLPYALLALPILIDWTSAAPTRERIPRLA